jgi:hypothetical protein
MVGPALKAVNERFGRRALYWAAVLAVIALVLSFLPLFDLLGYDFSFALGIGAAFAGVDIGQGVVARERVRSGTAWAAATPRELVRLLGRALAGGLALLVVPLLLSLLNALRIRNCNLPAGLGFFALLPVATMVYAAPAGVLVGLLVKRRSRLVALLLPVFSLLWSGARLYGDPAVFAYDPFGGYFPGPIYDEALRPPPTLLFFRLTNLVWIGTPVAFAAAALGRGFDPRRWRRLGLAAALVLLVASAVLFQLRGTLGFHVRRVDLAQALDGERRTRHFVLRYAVSAGKSKDDLDLQVEDLEFRYHQLQRTFAVEPRLPVTVYDFPSAEVKKRLVGAATTLFARPWSQEIFLQTDRFPARRLRHELAHVFASAFGDGLFGVALSWRWKGPLPVPMLASGLVEGVAEAADYSDPDDATTVHQDAQAIIADGRAPPLAAVVGAGFTTLSGARAYTLAGSFCHFLLQTRGAERLRALYRSAGDFTAVYQTSLDVLEREWRQFLERQPLTARDRSRAREQFRRPAIFKKVCARELAARVALARSLVRVDPARAVRLMEDTCRDDPGEPIFRIELAEARAAAGQTAQALEALARLSNQADVSDPLRARAASLAGTIHFHNGDHANAEQAERRVLTLAPEEAERRTAHAKLQALQTPGGRDTLGRALYGEALGASADPVLTFFLISEFARLFPDQRLGPYLVGRQLVYRDPTHSLPYLSRACGQAADARAPALPADFVRECRRMTGEAAYRAGDLGRSQAVYQLMMAEAERETDRLRAGDFLDRISWRRQWAAAGSQLP